MNLVALHLLQINEGFVIVPLVDQRVNNMNAPQDRSKRPMKQFVQLPIVIQKKILRHVAHGVIFIT